MAARQRTNKYQVQEVRLPIIGSMTNRSSSSLKDQRFVNVFPETRKVEVTNSTRIFLNKRPGLTLHKTLTTGTGRGIVWFRNRFYAAIDGKIMEDGVTPTAVITLTDATTRVGMVVANSSSVGDYLFICDGTLAWVIDSNGIVSTIGDNGVGKATIVSGGSGYTTGPYGYFTGVGTGAAAKTVLTAGVVTEIIITSSGTGYTTLPTISFSLPVIATNATDLFTSTVPHRMTVTDRVLLTSTGSLPSGITGAVYWIVNPTTTTFQVSLTSGGTPVLFTTDGTGTITAYPGGSTAVPVATAVANNFPTPHIPAPTFIDGYIVLAKDSDVYNCALDEPVVWNSGEYLTAEMFPDPVVALGRQNNQVVVFGESSVEFFYDAANASGSPLNRNESTTLQTGCAFPFAIYQNEKTFIFTGQSESGGRAVWQVDGFQPKKISDEYIDRIIDMETDTIGVRGFGFRSMGHLFYLINLPTLDRTLVYDTEEKLWHEWSTNNAGVHTSFMCSYMCDAHTGAAYLLHDTTGSIYRLDTTKYADDGNAILVDLITSKYDMDTYKRKFMANIRIVGDRYETGNFVTMRWSDDDYQTWSNDKTIELTDDFPNFARLGQFRRRAFNLKHNLNYPLRLESFEVTYYEGDS